MSEAGGNWRDRGIAAALLPGTPVEPCLRKMMSALLLPVGYALALYKRLEREDEAP